jgi:aminoglycoside phosphotransferase (APT) family kinase protein
MPAQKKTAPAHTSTGPRPATATPPAGGPTEDLETALGRVLGGSVRDLHRLSGGASRITSSFDLVTEDGTRWPLILQRDRGAGIAGPGRVRSEVALLRAAAGAGVPVPTVVAVGDTAADGLGAGWLVVERIEGETIPRKILRDAEWRGVRAALTAQCAAALAGIHAIDPEKIEGLPHGDPLHDPLAFVDALGEVRPAIEFGARWLETHRPPPVPAVALHGDFRMGNLLIGPDGLRAVLDWELAHSGDPAEDLGWLCAPAWRFGGPGDVGGFGEVTELLDAYAAAGGVAIDSKRLEWWLVYATVKWATICAMQASSHLSGASRSVELAAIGRRVCESEWDLFVLLGLAPDTAGVDGTETKAPAGSGPDMRAPHTPPAAADPTDALAPFGRPTGVELVEAVREYLERDVMEQSEGRAHFQARIARNVLAMVERELRLGPAIARAHRARLDALGFDSDRALATAIRSGACDGQWSAVAEALAVSAREQLLVANPSYLET